MSPGFGRFMELDVFLEPEGGGRSIDDRLLPDVGMGPGPDSSMVGASS